VKLKPTTIFFPLANSKIRPRHNRSSGRDDEGAPAKPSADDEAVDEAGEFITATVQPRLISEDQDGQDPSPNWSLASFSIPIGE
jgi:hypothetical protein